MQVINSTAQYYIQAQSQPNGYISTNVVSNLTLTTKSSAQLLTIAKSTHDATKWNICIPSGALCLDQYGNNVTQGVLQASGYFTGQQWTLTAEDESDDTTVWRLQSDFAGSNRYLAAEGANVVMIENAVVADTYWRFIDSASSQTSSPSTSAGSTVSSTGSSSNPASSATGTATGSAASSTDSATSAPHEAALSAGAAVGITIGAIVFIAGVALILFVFFRKRKAKKSRIDVSSRMPYTEQSEDPMLPSQEKRPWQRQESEISPSSRQANALYDHHEME